MTANFWEGYAPEPTRPAPMTTDRALDLALEALEGMAADLGKSESDVPAITAIKQARALDKMAENARELGLDYEPAGGTQVSKVWWDGEKLMAKPILLEDVYLPAPECTRSHPHENMNSMCELRTEIARLTNENARLKAQPAPVQEPPLAVVSRLGFRLALDEGLRQRADKIASMLRGGRVNYEVEQDAANLIWEMRDALVASTPPAQPAVQREHITDGRQCWCNPDIDYVDPETGAAVIVHKEPQ